MIKEKIFIAVAADDNYASHLAVMLVSALANLDRRYSLDIKILDAGISGENKGRLSVSLGCYDCVFEFVAVSKERLAQFSLGLGHGSYLSSATYLRLLLPELFPDAERIIYFDSDLIIRGDLVRLWETALDDKAVGVVPVLFSFYYDLLGENFSLPPQAGYFNAGVMLMDLKKLRAMNFTERALDFMIKNQNKLSNCADQDVLNVLLSGDFKKLGLAWNQTIESYIGRGFANTAASRYGFYSQEEFLAARAEPQVIHFDGALKPWHFGFIHPFQRLYFASLAKTEFRNEHKQFDAKKLFSFYSYYCLKFLPAPVYRMILPLLKKIYRQKNFRPKFI